VQTNLQRFDGRLYVLLLDDVHTATSRTDRVKAAASRFIEEDIGPADLAAVVHLPAPRERAREFTSDPRLLWRPSIGSRAGRCAPRPETDRRVNEQIS